MFKLLHGAVWHLSCLNIAFLVTYQFFCFFLQAISLRHSVLSIILTLWKTWLAIFWFIIRVQVYILCPLFFQWKYFAALNWHACGRWSLYQLQLIPPVILRYQNCSYESGLASESLSLALLCTHIQNCVHWLKLFWVLGSHLLQSGDFYTCIN